MKKLTQADRATIVRRLHAGETQKSLSDEYDVSQSTISSVLSQAKKAKREIVDDPNPAISTETLQKRYWSKYTRLKTVIENRQKFLEQSPAELEHVVGMWIRRSKNAPTPQLAESYKHRADSYRLELASLNDLSEFDTEMLELLTELKTLAEVLVKVRGQGMGKVKTDF